MTLRPILLSEKVAKAESQNPILLAGKERGSKQKKVSQCLITER